MADIADKANEQAQLILEKQIALQRGKPLDIYQNESNRCWFCDGDVVDGRRWWDELCRDDYEREVGNEWNGLTLYSPR